MSGRHPAGAESDSGVLERPSLEGTMALGTSRIRGPSSDGRSGSDPGARRERVGACAERLGSASDSGMTNLLSLLRPLVLRLEGDIRAHAEADGVVHGRLVGEHERAK